MQISQKQSLLAGVMIFAVGLLISAFAYSKEKMKVTVDDKKAIGKLFVKAESCKPLLEWSDIREGDENLSYDLAIYYALKGELPELGERVLYKEGHFQNQLSVSLPLEPKTKYLWSFRLRDQEGKVSRWHIHNPTKSDFLGGINFYRNMWFGMKTPGKCQ